MKILGNGVRGVRWLPFVMVCIYTMLLGAYLMHLGSWDLSIPWTYPAPTFDEVWQLSLTKSLLDNGWILQNKYLGAPATADWYINAAPQTSGLHSVIMLVLGAFIHDAVKVQQVYYLVNFPLIAATTYFACRLLRLLPLPSAIISFLFPFLAYRFNFQIYAYLANYFCVPLALVPVYWAITGRYSENFAATQGRLLARVWSSMRSKEAILGAIFILIVAFSDGYYAFFTLLLMGFAGAARVFVGDWRRPGALVIPVALILLLIGVASAMMLPLKRYEREHRAEFYPGGVQDASMVKHPFEAEVYSSSLKLLFAPNPGTHRVPALAKLGNYMVETSNQGRRFASGSVAPLGLFGAVLFVCGLLVVAARASGNGFLAGQSIFWSSHYGTLLWSSIALGLFVFLCTISGGIGTLVALVYPSVRAYDRFALFLIFILYVGGGAAASHVLSNTVSLARRRVYAASMLVIGLLAQWDQIPANAWHGQKEAHDRYLAERSFVQQVEASLPPEAMVYNYPYSQYLSVSPYYGWGSYSQIRLYMHSKALRWSNGSGKNTPVEMWLERVSRLPSSQLLVVLAASGFKGVVVDRTVVKDDEFARFKKAYAQIVGGGLFEDKASGLAYGKLPDPGYRLEYDAQFSKPLRLIVTRPASIGATTRFPMVVNARVVEAQLAGKSKLHEVVLDAKNSLGLFLDKSKLERGDGITILPSKGGLNGVLRCKVSGDSVELELTNGSDFPWQLNRGGHPLTIGANLLRRDGTLLDWDKGVRITDQVDLASGASEQLSYPIEAIRQKFAPTDEAMVRLAMLQEGNAWFSDISCTFPISP
ncbi:hypothetical protein NB691_002557 [Xanthomonas sacchari]|nr:hypothetical protein [Xanthomonas sacchari]